MSTERIASSTPPGHLRSNVGTVGGNVAVQVRNKGRRFFVVLLHESGEYVVVSNPTNLAMATSGAERILGVLA